MNIQVPWKMRKKSGPQGSPREKNWWVRRKFRDDLNTAKRPDIQREEDLDHLGAVHKHTH